QTGKAALIPVVMIDAPGGTYWQHWRTYISAELLRTGMISPEDMHLFYITDSVDSAVTYITRFYRHYHSSRYVDGRLVLRLNVTPSEELIEQLNDEFSDILVEGRVEPVAPVEQEMAEFPEKCRLALAFDRRSHGRLHQMIDRINSFEPDAVPAAA